MASVMENCDYCVNGHYSNKTIKSEIVDIRLLPVKTVCGTKLAMELDYDVFSYDGFEEIIDINYCPMCGRELKEVEGMKNYIQSEVNTYTNGLSQKECEVVEFLVMEYLHNRIMPFDAIYYLQRRRTIENEGIGEIVDELSENEQGRVLESFGRYMKNEI